MLFGFGVVDAACFLQHIPVHISWAELFMCVRVSAGYSIAQERYPAQRRLSDVRFLGELFNYELIHAPVIFQTLYVLLSLGHRVVELPADRYDALRTKSQHQHGHASRAAATTEEGAEAQGVLAHHVYHASAVSVGNAVGTATAVGGTSTVSVLMSAVDPPSDTFRIRLVVMLLQTCGEFFNKGINKEKLDRFLCYFQRYIFLKPLAPVDLLFAGAALGPNSHFPLYSPISTKSFPPSSTQHHPLNIPFIFSLLANALVFSFECFFFLASPPFSQQTVWDMLDAIAPSVVRFTSLQQAHSKCTSLETEDRSKADKGTSMHSSPPMCALHDSVHPH